VFEVLRDILIEELQISAEAITPTATRTEVGLDSVAVLELAAVLNSRLGIEVHDYELLDAVTVADVAELVEERSAALDRP
jgi:acyl carrier protein